MVATTTEFKLVGAKNFVRNNPRSDKFAMHRFHSIEFWTSDATNVFKRCVCVTPVALPSHLLHKVFRKWHEAQVSAAGSVGLGEEGKLKRATGKVVVASQAMKYFTAIRLDPPPPRHLGTLFFPLDAL
jgi:hypothetical protein